PRPFPVVGRILRRNPVKDCGPRRRSTICSSKRFRLLLSFPRRIGVSIMLASTLFSLPPLPYPENALEPVISATTLNFHHGKHHKTYVETLNKLIKGTDYESSSLESIVADTAGKPDKAQVFNNAAQTR